MAGGGCVFMPGESQRTVQVCVSQSEDFPMAKPQDPAGPGESWVDVY